MSSPVLAIGCLLSSLMLAAGVYLVLGSMQHPSPRSSSSANKTAISKQASNSPTPNKNDPGSANSITVKNDSGTANSTASTANSTAQKSSSNIDAEDAAKKTDTTSGAKESNLVREVSATNDQKSAGQKHKHHKSNNNLAENHSHRHGSNQNQLAGESTVADSPTNESESTSYSHKRSHDWQDFSYGVEQKDSYAHSWSVPMAGSKRKY